MPAEYAARAREQLRLYRTENRPRPAKPELVLHGHGLPGVVAYVLVLVAVFLVQVRAGYGVDWLGAGELAGSAVRAGDWWRVFTALTLHADAGHLVANLFFGAFFGAFAGQLLGSGWPGRPFSWRVARATLLMWCCCRQHTGPSVPRRRFSRPWVSSPHSCGGRSPAGDRPGRAVTGR